MTIPNQSSVELPQTGFVRLPTVLKFIPVSRSAWWSGCQSGKYPKPVKLGEKTTAWRCEDIHALIASFSEAEAA